MWKHINRIVSLTLSLLIFVSVISFSIVPASSAITVPAEVKGKTVSEVLGIDPGEYLSWLESHENDNYYLGTPYKAFDYRNPNGDCSGKYGSKDVAGQPGMNCTGFVWHVLYKTSHMSVENAQSKIPALGRKKWLEFYEDNNISRKYFSSKKAMLDSGYLNKGDIIWMYVNGDEESSNNYHHVGIYYGTGSDDVLWHSSDHNGTNDKGNFITKIKPKYDGKNLYMVLKFAPSVISIKKKSANPATTDNNDNYSFKDIKYCVYKPTTDFTTGSSNPNYIGYISLAENGEGDSLHNGSNSAIKSLSPGEYYVKEYDDLALRESGYKYNDTVYKINVTREHTFDNPYVISPVNEPYECAFKLVKHSMNPELTNDNTNFSFSGIEYCVFTSKNSTVTDSSNPDFIGYITLDENGVAYSSQGNNDRIKHIGIGRYYVRERNNSALNQSGYALNNTWYEMDLTESHTDDNPFVLDVYDSPKSISSAIIRKKSSKPNLTDNNASYTLEGAKFNVYTSAEDAAADNNALITDITTGSNGIAYIPEIANGTYYVKETVAPKGFIINNTPIKFVVSDNPENVIDISVFEEPIMAPVSLLLQKRNATTGITEDPSLSGAQYEIKYYKGLYSSESALKNVVADKSWIFETDDAGKIMYNGRYLISGDALFLGGQFPLGTVTIKEIKAPNDPVSFYLDNNLYIIPIYTDGSNNLHSYNAPVSNEYEIPRTNISVSKVWDDADDRDGLRPEAVTVYLNTVDDSGNKVRYKSANGNDVYVTLNESNQWSDSFTDLPIKEADGRVINYDIEEDVPSGYVVSYSGSVEQGFTITNTHEWKRTTLTVSKQWFDNDDQDGIRPSSIMVSIYRNDKRFIRIKLSDENGWKYTLRNLPVNDKGIPIQYSISEDGITLPAGYEGEGYTVTCLQTSNSAEKGYEFTLQNTHSVEKVNAIVKKKWNDLDNREALRPNSITFNLIGYVDNEIVYESNQYVMTESGNGTDDSNLWSQTIEGLDKYYNGKVITYYAKEITVIDDYNLDDNRNPTTLTVPLTLQEDGSLACVLENTHEQSKRTLNVVKYWDDDDNRDGLRPEKVYVYVATIDQNGNKTRYTDDSGNNITGVLQASNDWSYVFTNLPIYGSNKEIIRYSVEEVIPDGYTATYSGDDASGITITNVHHETTSVTVNKVWEDDNDNDRIRPTSVTVTLYADGSRVSRQKLKAENNWTYTFDNLPVHKNGVEIKYTIVESAVSIPREFAQNGYTARYSNMRGDAQSGYSITVTNVHESVTRDISVTKEWDDNDNHDGIRPKQIEVALSVISPTNTGIATRFGYMSEENNWRYTFSNLPKYYNGELIQYSVDETEPVIPESINGYTKTVTGNMDGGFTIRNTHINERIKVIIQKVWDDNNNAAHLRPNNAEFEITGYQGQVTHVTLNASNNWYYECEYDKYYNGAVQNPSIKEIHLAEGYVAHKTQEESFEGSTTTFEYTVTNSFELDPTEIPVKKIWDDYDNWENSRPDGYITINLYRRPVDGSNAGELVTGTMLSEANNWEDSFHGFFPRYINGIEYEYFVEEQFSSSRYTTSVTGNKVEGFTVTNTLNIPHSFDIPFKKVWLDDNNKDGIRPESIDILLTGYNEEGEEISKRYATVKASENWEYIFNDLPSFYKEDDGYSKITYYVEEISQSKGYEPQTIYDGYEYGDVWLWSEIDATYKEDNDWLGLVNEHTSETTSVTISKSWNDSNNRDKVRPAAITVNLLANGIKVDEAQLNEQNGWLHCFTNVYVYDNGQPITYTVTESGFSTPSGFADYVLEPIEISGNSKDGWYFTLTNTYQPVLTQVDVVKRWNDNHDHRNLRPTQLRIILKADGVPVREYVMTSDDFKSTSGSYDLWQYTFDNLPKYNNGVEIQYTAEEVLSENDARAYQCKTRIRTVSGHKKIELTNTENTATITLKKLDEKGKATSAKFEVYFADGTPVNFIAMGNSAYMYAPDSVSANNVINMFGMVALNQLPIDAMIYVKEISAAEGYSTYDNPIYIDVQQTIKDNNVQADSTYSYKLPVITVNNYKTIMPVTGGMGNHIFYVLSGLFLIGTFIIYIKKRKEDEP